MEGWKVGRLEGWKVGRLEGWKVGRLEGWKVGRFRIEDELVEEFRIYSTVYKVPIISYILLRVFGIYTI